MASLSLFLPQSDDAFYAQQPVSKPVPQRPVQSTPDGHLHARRNCGARCSASRCHRFRLLNRVRAVPRNVRLRRTMIGSSSAKRERAPPLRKLCEMTQLTQLQVQGKTQPFSRIVVPQPVKGMPSGLVVQVPVNVTFANKVKIQTSDTDQGIEVSVHAMHARRLLRRIFNCR